MLSLSHDVSKRLRDILNVLDDIRSASPQSLAELRNVRIRATDAAASKHRITPNTVLDKYSRQLGFQVEQFEDLIWRWLSNGDGHLQTVLLEHSASTDPETDRQAVRQFFSGSIKTVVRETSGTGDTDQPVVKYLQQFKGIADEWFAKSDFVAEHYRFFQEFFRKENLAKCEWTDIQEIGDHIHSFNSMAIAKKNALGNPNHPIEHYRKSFMYLAHGDGTPAERIRRFCEDEQYRLKYFGDSAVSELVGYVFPADFMFVNARDQFAADFLGIELLTPSSGDLIGELESFAKATRPVAEQYGAIVGKRTALPLNLELDQFFSWIYETFGDAGKPESEEKLDDGSRRFWTYAAGPGGEHWEEFYDGSIMAIGWDDIGDLNQYDSKEAVRKKLVELYGGDSDQKNNAHACWQFARDVRKGDVILAKMGLTTLLGYGVVEGDYRFDVARTHYKHIRKVKWLAKGKWELPEDSKMAMKTLTDITAYTDFVKLLTGKVGLNLGHGKKGSANGLPSMSTGYWWLNANPKIWNFEETPVGEKQTYTSHNEKGNKRQKFKYFQEVKPGDIVVGYVTSPQQEVVAICRITKALHNTEEGEVIEFEKVEQLSKPIAYETLQANPDLATSEPIVSNQGSLFKLTEQEFEIIRNLIDEANIAPKVEIEKYDKKKAMKGLFLAEAQFDEMLDALKEKKNVVLQGAPGVGKTYVAKRLAYAFIGSNDTNRIETIQFHQSYSYEDFIQGFRPAPKGHFDLKYGLFHQFCRKAQREEAQSKPYVFIIDEINRGNLSKIFGELMMLIEPDKRGKEHAIPLAYSADSDERFYIPENLYFIGMMNTADRSLAMVDYALRRRFRFVTLQPEFASNAFRDYLTNAGVKPELVKKIIDRMTALNEVIAADSKNLGHGYRIGHSYFCPQQGIVPNESWYRRIVESEIVPLIQEYWFDNEQKVKEQRAALLA